MPTIHCPSTRALVEHLKVNEATASKMHAKMRNVLRVPSPSYLLMELKEIAMVMADDPAYPYVDHSAKCVWDLGFRGAHDTVVGYQICFGNYTHLNTRLIFDVLQWRFRLANIHVACDQIKRNLRRVREAEGS